jgi:hypothetical protein
MMLKNSLQRHPYLTLFGLAWLFRLLVALLFRQPGYSDAYYYCDIAQSLWQGQGFHENFIWNYLGRPLPATVFNNPSSTYWLPFTSILIYCGYLLTGGTSFLAAQIPITLVSASLAPLCYYIALDIFGPQPGKRYGWLMGLLMVFCGVYTPYFSLPDNFAPFALLTSLFLVCTYKALRLLPTYSKSRRQVLTLMALAGILAGLSYLTRVDGVFLLLVAILSMLSYRYLLKDQTALNWEAIALMLLTFGMTIAPWLWHNLQDSHQLFPGGGIKTLLLREYNDFFSYAKPLDLAYYLNQTDPNPTWGLGPLLLSKLDALWANLTIVARGCLFFMTPLFVLGLFSRQLPPPTSADNTDNIKTPTAQTLLPLKLSWMQPNTLWRKPEFLPFVLYLAILYLSMSLLFTFPSTRGSVFHSSGGLLPFIFALIAVGLDMLVLQLSKITRPSAKAARSRLRVYTAAIIVGSACTAIFFPFSLLSDWNNDYNQLQQIGQWLASHNQNQAILMVPDAPAYYYVTHKPAIVISNDSIPTDLDLASRYGATYLLFQSTRFPDPLAPLYQNHSYPGLTLVTRFGQNDNYTELYQITHP